MLNFPAQNQFLFRKIWTTLASSVVLLLVIIACFVYALLTIIRQKKLSEMKSDFINNMTHELKTPIATVALACEALGEDAIASDKATFQRYLGMIEEENKRLGDQVEKVLQTALLDKKDFKLNLKPIVFDRVVNQAVEKIRITLESKGGEISESLRADVSIEADELHLTNVVLNLLDNAIKYSNNAPSIAIRSYLTDDRIVLEVQDHGIGMSREVSKRIFDKFYRMPTGNVHNVKGFGLGLSYVQSVVIAHGGQVGVKSEPEKGSTFTISIPLVHE